MASRDITSPGVLYAAEAVERLTRTIAERDVEIIRLRATVDRVRRFAETTATVPLFTDASDLSQLLNDARRYVAEAVLAAIDPKDSPHAE